MSIDLERVEQATLCEMRDALARGQLSARELLEAHLARIEALDGTYNAVLTINPQAQAIADALDAERAAGKLRGALHGVPVLVKDNLDTGDAMPTTAGSLALAGTRAGSDSTVVRKLREAGAVLLGKTNLSEWANFRSTRSSSGWSSVGGQTRNAYDPARTPGGSSSGSGVAVALGLCAGAIGTETDGSIVSPASMNGIVGFKPSVGLVSRAGIVPISASQDTAGPMARCVRDAAALLCAIAGPDALDPATTGAGAGVRQLEASLVAADLRGVTLDVASTYAGYHDRVDRLLADAVEGLRDAGACVIDEVELPRADAIREHERIVMEYEFKHGLNAYLAARDDSTPVRSLSDVIAFNAAHCETVMPHFAQEIHLSAEARGPLTDPAYRAARDRSLAAAAREGIDAALQSRGLDAILAPTTGPPWLIDWVCGDNRSGSAACPAAVCGYPHVTVPMGFVEHLPVGLSIFSGARRDAEVLRIAHAFETITAHRRAPRVAPAKAVERGSAPPSQRGPIRG